MDIKFKLVDDDEQIYGTFRKLEDARLHAQDMANEFNKDIFIEKITIENVDCVIPD